VTNGCATTRCRYRQPGAAGAVHNQPLPQAARCLGPGDEAGPGGVGSTGAESARRDPGAATRHQRVRVYAPDGSDQQPCGAAAPTSWRSSITTPPTTPPRPSTDAWKRCAATPSDSETSSTTEGAHRCTAAHSTHSSMHSELRRAGNASVRRHRAGCRRGDQPYEAANSKW
jgi:hypothetical protein